MKKRKGFVSNSSSSSFIINIDKFEENRSKFELEYDKRKEEYSDKKDRWRDVSKEEMAKEFDTGYQLFLADVYNRTDNPVLETDDIIENHLMTYINHQSDYKKEPYKIDERYETYNIGTTYMFKSYMAMNAYYILKPALDNKIARLNLLREFDLIREQYHFDLYENNIGPESAKIYIDYPRSKKNDKKWTKYQLHNIKLLMKMTSKEFFNYLLDKYFLDRWDLDYEKVYKKTKSKMLKKTIVSVVNAINNLNYNIVNDFYEKNKGQRFIEVEYSDSGGCGTTNIFLHNGNIVNEFKTLYICNH